MKSIRLFYIFLGVILLGMTSCKKDKMVVKPVDIQLSCNGGDTTIIVSGCDSTYEVAYAPKWVEIERHDSVLNCRFLYNSSGTNRKDSIVIKHGEDKAVVRLTQWKKATYIKVSEEKLEFPLDGGVKTVKVDCDGGGIEVVVPALITAVLDKGVLTVTVPDKLEEHLEGMILLVSDDIKVGISVTGGPKARPDALVADEDETINADAPMSGELDAQ